MLTANSKKYIQFMLDLSDDPSLAASVLVHGRKAIELSLHKCIDQSIEDIDTVIDPVVTAWFNRQTFDNIKGNWEESIRFATLVLGGAS